MLKLKEDILPRPPQALLPVPRAVSGFIGVMYAVQKYPFRVSLLKRYYMWLERKDEAHDKSTALIIDVLLQRSLKYMSGMGEVSLF